MAHASEVDRYIYEQDILFEVCRQRRAVVEHIADKLLAEMRQISYADPHTLASVARQWTFTVMREKSVAEPVAADVAGTVAERIRGAFSHR